MKNYFEILQEKNEELLVNIKKKLPELKKLFDSINGHWTYEDLIYRFYHNSFKVYAIQSTTKEIVEMLESCTPEKVDDYDNICKRDSFFDTIFKEGSDKNFNSSHNEDWLKHTRPMIEAFFHAKFFLEMAIKYGDELDKAPTLLPSGWAALLYFYGMR